MESAPCDFFFMRGTLFLAGNHLFFLSTLEVKGCLEPPGFGPWTCWGSNPGPSDSLPDAMTTQPKLIRNIFKKKLSLQFPDSLGIFLFSQSRINMSCFSHHFCPSKIKNIKRIFLSHSHSNSFQDGLSTRCFEFFPNAIFPKKVLANLA